MKKILVINGSANKRGNTDKLANAFVKGASKIGHDVIKVCLGDSEIFGCRGCNVCRTGEKPCVLKDGITDILPNYIDCDVIVIATPLYAWTMTARMHIFFERLYSVLNRLGRLNKECVLLMTAAQEGFWAFDQAVSYYQTECISFYGWKDRGRVLAYKCGGVWEAEKQVNEEYLKEAYNLGLSI